MSWDAIIIGFGPGGAACSWLLASRGLRVLAIERHRNFSREFRGEGIQPSGLLALQQMGLGEAIEALPQRRAKRIRIWNGARLCEMRVPAALGADVRIISQPHMLEMFADKCSEYPGFELWRGATFSELIEEEGRVVGVSVRTEDGLIDVRARLVIATDGRFSAVARAMGGERIELEQGFDVLWMRLPLGGLLEDDDTAWVEVDGRGGIALAYSSPMGGAQVGVIVAKGEVPQTGPGQLDWLRGRVSPMLSAALVAGWPDVIGPVRLPVVCSRMARWTAPGVLLLGDAAHPMSPVGAQGINMALRDAVVAANHLVPLFSAGAEGSSLDAAAEAVAAERLEEITLVQAGQTRSGARMMAPPKLLLWALPYLARLGVPFRPDKDRARMQHGLKTVELAV